MKLRKYRNFYGSIKNIKLSYRNHRNAEIYKIISLTKHSYQVLLNWVITLLVFINFHKFPYFCDFCIFLVSSLQYFHKSAICSFERIPVIFGLISISVTDSKIQYEFLYFSVAPFLLLIAVIQRSNISKSRLTEIWKLVPAL